MNLEETKTNVLRILELYCIIQFYLYNSIVYNSIVYNSIVISTSHIDHWSCHMAIREYVKSRRYLV